eukprot:867756-Rhodomonas_salina.1
MQIAIIDSVRVLLLPGYCCEPAPRFLVPRVGTYWVRVASRATRVLESATGVCIPQQYRIPGSFRKREEIRGM